MMKRVSVAFVCMALIIVIMSSCTDRSSSDNARQAYKEVLKQYQSAATLPWEEYLERKSDFPFVNERAIQNYPGGGYLLYAYYDLNDDGKDELLIVSNYDIPDHDTPLSAIDVFTYNDEKVHSILANKIGFDEENTKVFKSQIHKDKTITVDIYSGYYERDDIDGRVYPAWNKTETYVYGLNTEGEKLETLDYLLIKNGKYYHGEEEVSWEEYHSLCKENDTYEIPYEPLVND